MLEGLDFLSGLELAPFGLELVELLAFLLSLELVVACFFCFTVFCDDFDDEEEVVEYGGVGLIPNMLRMLSGPGIARKLPLLRLSSRS